MAEVPSLLFTNLNPHPFKCYRLNSEKGLGRGQNCSRYRGRAKKRRFHHSHQVKVICPRSRQYNLKTGRELTAKRYQHKSTLCPQYHLYPTPMFENPLRRETLRQLNGFLLVRINFLSMTEISAES